MRVPSRIRIEPCVLPQSLRFGAPWKTLTLGPELDAADLFDDEKRGGGRCHPFENHATARGGRKHALRRLGGTRSIRAACLPPRLQLLRLLQIAEDHRAHMSTQRFHVERLRLAGRSRLQAAGHHDEQREQVFVAQRDARLTVSGAGRAPAPRR